MRKKLKKDIICVVDDINGCLLSLKIAKVQGKIDYKLYNELYHFFVDLKYILIGWL